jgi:hypothetical protein
MAVIYAHHGGTLGRFIQKVKARQVPATSSKHIRRIPSGVRTHNENIESRTSNGSDDHKPKNPVPRERRAKMTISDNPGIAPQPGGRYTYSSSVVHWECGRRVFGADARAGLAPRLSRMRQGCSCVRGC